MKLSLKVVERKKNMNLRRNRCIELILVILGLTVDYVSCSPNSYPREKRAKKKVDLGKPLRLTPYLADANNADGAEKARILEEARNLSKVTFPELPDIVSYSGSFTVRDWNDQLSSHLFWYFPAQVDSENAPVVLFLDSMWEHGDITTAAVQRNGPFMINGVGHLKKREESWNKKQNIIYMSDAFSAAGSLRFWWLNTPSVANVFPGKVLQFFELFPWLRKNDFFVVGERLSGYYVPFICEHIRWYNKKVKQGEKINLKGIAMGNPLFHLRDQSNIEKYLYESGLIDAKGKEIFLAKQKEVYNSTINLYSNDEGNVKGSVEFLFHQLAAFSSTSTGYETLFTILEDRSYPDHNNDREWKQKKTRDALHLVRPKGTRSTFEPYYTGWGTFRYDNENIVEVLRNFRVLIYTGNLDVFCSYPNVENSINKLTKPSISIKQIKRAERQKWIVDDELAGYIRKGGNLTEVLIRNAGHFPAIDQPKWNRKLIESFIDGSLYI